MIWLWRISFSLAAGLALQGASVTGSVQLEDARSPGMRKRDFSGVVVSLWPAAGARAPLDPGRARMIQKNKTFIPHVLAIEVGATVDFPNYDPIYHNAFSNYDGQIFDIGLYAPGTSRSVIFRRQGVVRVFCNIHSAMSAVIVVLPTPYFATTGRDGGFEIADVPAGRYTLRLFHERATPATLESLERSVTVGDAALALGRIVISESGYLPIPHTNKYGHPYPPEADATGLYPATRK
jgi:plastocyanin